VARPVSGGGHIVRMQELQWKSPGVRGSAASTERSGIAFEASPSECGRWRRIQYSVLPEPANGSITCAPGVSTAERATAAMSWPIASASRSRVHSTAVRPSSRMPLRTTRPVSVRRLTRSLDAIAVSPVAETSHSRAPRCAWRRAAAVDGRRSGRRPALRIAMCPKHSGVCMV